MDWCVHQALGAAEREAARPAANANDLGEELVGLGHQVVLSGLWQGLESAGAAPEIHELHHPIPGPRALIGNEWGDQSVKVLDLSWGGQGPVAAPEHRLVYPDFSGAVRSGQGHAHAQNTPVGVADNV